MAESKTLGQINERSTNIELLRILMMLSLVAHHFTVNSGITNLYDFHHIAGNMVFLQVFGMWGKTAINVFTLITGYFMVEREMTLKRFLKLFLEACFYMYMFYAIFVAAGYQTFSIKELIKTVLFIPYEAGISYSASMFIMMLLIPFANILAKAMDKRQYQIFLILLLVYFSGISTFLKQQDTFDFVFWMLAVYLLGGYLRLYPSRWDKMHFGIVGTICSVILMAASIVILDLLRNRFGIERDYYYFVSDANKLLAVTASVSIFILFKNWKLKYIGWINRIAATTFGVLMIHANSDAMRKFLWKDLFDNAGHYSDGSLAGYAIGVVLLVYLVCVAVDFLRIRFIEKPLFQWLDKYKWIHKSLW